MDTKFLQVIIKPNLFQQLYVQEIFANSLLDPATTYCFFEDQDTRESPIKTQWSAIDRRSPRKQANMHLSKLSHDNYLNWEYEIHSQEFPSNTLEFFLQVSNEVK